MLADRAYWLSRVGSMSRSLVVIPDMQIRCNAALRQVCIILQPNKLTPDSTSLVLAESSAKAISLKSMKGSLPLSALLSPTGISYRVPSPSTPTFTV